MTGILPRETSGLFLGAMLPQQFLRRYLPIGPDTPVSELEGGIRERFERKERGSYVYPIRKHGPLSPHLLRFTSIWWITTATAFAVLVDTRGNPDARRHNIPPDISVYVDDNVPDADNKTDFSQMELCIELKLVETPDPFRDPKDPLQPQAENFGFGKDSYFSIES